MPRIRKTVNNWLVPKLLLDKDQAAPGFAGFWAKQGLGYQKGSQAGAGEPENQSDA